MGCLLQIYEIKISFYRVTGGLNPFRGIKVAGRTGKKAGYGRKTGMGGGDAALEALVGQGVRAVKAGGIYASHITKKIQGMPCAAIR